MKKLSAALLSLLFLYSCGPKTSSVSVSDFSSGLGQSEVSFATLKSSVLTPKCLSCHSEVKTESGISAWVTPGSPEQSRLYTEVKSGSMPKGSTQLSGAELEMVYNYIYGLTSPTDPTPPPIPTPTPTPAPSTGITYAQVRARILTPYRCTSCHSVGSETALARWISVSSPSSSKFYTSVKNGSMPQGGSDLSADDKAYVLQYVKDYAASH